MRAEFYISQIVRWNAVLRAKVAGAIGFPGRDDPEDVLMELRGPIAIRDLARRLKCAPDAVFDVLRKKVIGEHQAENAVTRRSRPLLEVLRSDQFTTWAAEILGTKATRRSVWDSLFDQNEIERVIGMGKTGNGDPPDVESVVGRLLRPEGVRVVLKTYQVLDLAAALPSLMREDAAEAVSRALGCEVHEIGRRLGERIEEEPQRSSRASNEGKLPPDDGSPRLDLFGVERLREMLRPIERYMLRQARDAGEKILAHDVAPHSARYALALVEFWGDGSFRKALRSLPQAVPRPKTSELS